MAIPLPLADFLCAEHGWKPLPERILLLGRQSMPFDTAALEALSKKHGLPMPAVEIDRITSLALQNPAESWISDKTFFQMLGVESIRAIDHSDFEGADIILDLCEPVPSDLSGQFEFIFNGSVLTIFSISAQL